MTATGGRSEPTPFTLVDLPLRAQLRGLHPYGAPQLDVPVRLNTNENSYPVPAAVVAAMSAALAAELSGLNRYPDRDAVALRADLAAYLGHGLDAERVWAANGSNEVQQQLFQAFGGAGRTALGFTPSYSMHPLLAVGTGTGWVDGRRAEDFTLSAATVVEQVRRVRPHLVFLCSPNNPTGTALDLDVVRAALDETGRATPPDGAGAAVVVVDEAYAEFARAGVPSALSLLVDHPRLVVTRTMSKAFGFAGGRLGYLAAHPAVVQAVQLVRLPYHLSALTQAAARAALAHAGALLGTVEAIKSERDRIVSELRAAGLTVADSDANFVLFQVPADPAGGSGAAAVADPAGGSGAADVADPAAGAGTDADPDPAAGAGRDQRRVWQALLDAGVLVRDVGLSGWLRVTAGNPAETDSFLTALRKVLP